MKIIINSILLLGCLALQNSTLLSQEFYSLTTEHTNVFKDYIYYTHDYKMSKFEIRVTGGLTSSKLIIIDIDQNIYMHEYSRYYKQVDTHGIKEYIYNPVTAKIELESNNLLQEYITLSLFNATKEMSIGIDDRDRMYYNVDFNFTTFSSPIQYRGMNTGFGLLGYNIDKTGVNKQKSFDKRTNEEQIDVLINKLIKRVKANPNSLFSFTNKEKKYLKNRINLLNNIPQKDVIDLIYKINMTIINRNKEYTKNLGHENISNLNFILRNMMIELNDCGYNYGMLNCKFNDIIKKYNYSYQDYLSFVNHINEELYKEGSVAKLHVEPSGGIIFDWISELVPSKKHCDE